MITVATAGTLAAATVISVAATTLSTTTAAAGPADAYLTSVSANTAAFHAAHSAGGSTSTQQAVIFAKTRAVQAEHQQEVAAEKAAAKAVAAKAAAAKAIQTKQAHTPSGSPQQIAKQMLSQYGWSGSQFSCLNPLWGHESRWSVTAENTSSGAYGIPQALPGSQMASAGGDWKTSAATQIKWGLTYIQSRYGSPCGAEAHEQSAGWY